MMIHRHFLLFFFICLPLLAGASDAKTQLCPSAATLLENAPSSGMICVTQMGRLVFEEYASDPGAQPSIPKPCLALSIQQKLPKLNQLQIEASGGHPITQITLLVPGRQNICQTPLSIIIDRMMDIRYASIYADELQPYIYQEAITFVSQLYLVITGRDLTDTIEDLGQKTYENTRILRRQDLTAIKIADIFHPGSLSLNDPDLVVIGNMSPSLLDKIEAQYVAQAEDPACILIIQRLAPTDWHVSLHPDHLRFLPKLPRYGAYCVQELRIMAEDLNPWLNAVGADLLKRHLK